MKTLDNADSKKRRGPVIRALGIALVLIALVPVASPLSAEDEPTLAIMPVFSIGVDKTRSTIVYDYLVDQVNRTHAFTLVERAAIDRALSEIKFSMKEIIDERTAARVGKISGAKYILIPALYLSEGVFHLSLRVIETETARIKNTAVKTTDSFKNVEGLTAQAALALLDLDTAKSALNATATSPTTKKLWGNSYFFDDRDAGGSSTLETGIAKDGIFTLRGQMVYNAKACWLGGGMDFDEAGIKLIKKSKGVRLKASGGNQFFTIELKMASIKDFVYHQLVVFIPEKETEIFVPFANLEMPAWAKKKIAFSRDDVHGIEFNSFSQQYGSVKVDLVVKDITAVTDEEKPAFPAQQSLNVIHYWITDEGSKGTSQVTNSYLEGDFAILEGRVTNVYPYGFIGMALDFDEESKAAVSKAKGITFRVAGDGKQYKFSVKTPTVDGDYYAIVLKTEKEFKQVTMLFKDLKQQGWGKPMTFNKKDILGIEVLTQGQPWQSVRVMLGDIEYLPE